MQPAPTEASQNATSVEITLASPSTSNHGLQEHLQPASGSFSSSAREPQAVPSDDNDALSVSSGDTSRGRQPNNRRLKSGQGSSPSTSPGSRIDDYERKHAKPRKRKDGMIFQVVPGKDKPGSGTIEEFPNGIPLLRVHSHH